MKRDDIYEDFHCVTLTIAEPPVPAAPDATSDDTAEPEPCPVWREWLEFLWYDVARYRWVLLILGLLAIGMFVPPARGLLAYITTTPWSLVGAIVIAYVVLTGGLEPGGTMLPDRPARKKETPPERVSLDDVPFAPVDLERDRKRWAWGMALIGGLVLYLRLGPDRFIALAILWGIIFLTWWALNRLL